MAQQFLVNDPFTPFTVNNQFKAVANGKVYVGIECGDPLNVSQQIQVYHKNGCGDCVPVSQPIAINAGGFLSYNGGASQFVVKQPFSIVVKNANNVEEWRVDKVFNLSGDDWNGFSNALLSEAGITPNGLPDTAIASQRLDALSKIHGVNTSIAELPTHDYPLNTIVRLIDYNNALAVIQNGGTVNGYNVFNAGGGKTALVYKESILETYTEQTFYVDQDLGSDAWGAGLSPGSGAYKTLQFAWDSLPNFINKKQEFALFSGTCNQTSRSAASMPRPAIFYPQGKYIAKRTAQSGTDLTGMVVIRGAGVGVSIIETDPAGGYPYGVYVSGTEIALQDLSIKPKSGASSSSLLVSHRGAYVHGRNLDVGGVGAGIGLVCEAGGWAEIISSKISGSTADVVVYATSACSLAGAGSDIGNVTCTGFIQFAQSCTANGAIRIASGGDMQTTSSEVLYKTIFNGDLTLQNANLTASFSDFNENIVARGSNVQLAVSGWQKAMTALGGSVRLQAAKSYVSPNTQSSVAIPLTLRDANLVKDAATEIRSSTGLLVSEDYGNQLVQVNANGFVIPINQDGQVITQYVNGGAAYTGCTIGDIAGMLLGTPAGDGTVLHMIGRGGNVEIVNGTTAVIPTGAVTIGSQSGARSGATWVYASLEKKWLLIGVGLLIP